MTGALRVAVVGAGGIANAYHLPAMQKVETLAPVVVADTSEERARLAARHYGFHRWTTEVEEALGSPDVDAVFIFTPNASHAPLTELAASYGKHVFVQKAMGRSVAECRRMVEACRVAGVRLVPSFMHRYLPEVQAARHYIHQGFLGTIETVRIRNAPGAASLVAADYYSSRLVGGGAILDVGVHGIDLTRYLVGEIESIMYARMRTTKKSIVFPDRIVYPDNENLALAVYQTQGEADVIHEISWHQRTTADRFTMEIHGAEGSILLRGGPGALALSAERFGRGSDWVVPALPVYDSGERHHSEVVASLLGGHDHNGATGEDGLRAAEIIEAIYALASRPQAELA